MSYKRFTVNGKTISAKEKERNQNILLITSSWKTNKNESDQCITKSLETKLSQGTNVYFKGVSCSLDNQIVPLTMNVFQVIIRCMQEAEKRNTIFVDLVIEVSDGFPHDVIEVILASVWKYLEQNTAVSYVYIIEQDARKREFFLSTLEQIEKKCTEGRLATAGNLIFVEFHLTPIMETTYKDIDVQPLPDNQRGFNLRFQNAQMSVLILHTDSGAMKLTEQNNGSITVDCVSKTTVKTTVKERAHGTIHIECNNKYGSKKETDLHFNTSMNMGDNATGLQKQCSHGVFETVQFLLDQATEESVRSIAILIENSNVCHNVDVFKAIVKGVLHYMKVVTCIQNVCFVIIDQDMKQAFLKEFGMARIRNAAVVDSNCTPTEGPTALRLGSNSTESMNEDGENQGFKKVRTLDVFDIENSKLILVQFEQNKQSIEEKCSISTTDEELALLYDSIRKQLAEADKQESNFVHIRDQSSLFHESSYSIVSNAVSKAVLEFMKSSKYVKYAHISDTNLQLLNKILESYDAMELKGVNRILQKDCYNDSDEQIVSKDHDMNQVNFPSGDDTSDGYMAPVTNIPPRDGYVDALEPVENNNPNAELVPCNQIHETPDGRRVEDTKELENNLVTIFVIGQSSSGFAYSINDSNFLNEEWDNASGSSSLKMLTAVLESPDSIEIGNNALIKYHNAADPEQLMYIDEFKSIISGKNESNHEHETLYKCLEHVFNYLYESLRIQLLKNKIGMKPTKIIVVHNPRADRTQLKKLRNIAKKIVQSQQVTLIPEDEAVAMWCQQMPLYQNKKLTSSKILIGAKCSILDFEDEFLTFFKVGSPESQRTYSLTGLFDLDAECRKLFLNEFDQNLISRYIETYPRDWHVMMHSLKIQMYGFKATGGINLTVSLPVSFFKDVDIRKSIKKKNMQLTKHKDKLSINIQYFGKILDKYTTMVIGLLSLIEHQEEVIHFLFLIGKASILEIPIKTANQKTKIIQHIKVPKESNEFALRGALF